MGLYLAIFEHQTELGGFEIGSYQDFDDFRQTIADKLENGEQGSKFPILQLHSDCDGRWPVSELQPLLKELEEIKGEFKKLPPFKPAAYKDVWQGRVLDDLNLGNPDNLYSSFFDCNGEPYLEGILRLVRLGLKEELPILFQ